MSGNQTSSKEGGVQYVMMFVYMYVCVCIYMCVCIYLISYISN